MIVPEPLTVTLPRVAGPRWYYTVICVKSRLVAYEGTDEDRAVNAMEPGTVLGKVIGYDRKQCRRLARGCARIRAAFARNKMEGE